MGSAGFGGEEIVFLLCRSEGPICVNASVREFSVRVRESQRCFIVERRFITSSGDARWSLDPRSNSDAASDPDFFVRFLYQGFFVAT